jgi:uncharacterized delta-60 repeat protein
MSPITTLFFDEQLAQDLTTSGGGGGGRSGTRKVVIPGDNWSEWLAGATDETGRIIGVGTSHQGGALTLPFVNAQFDFRAYLWRLLPNGDPDVAGGSGGMVQITVGGEGVAGCDNESTDVLIDTAAQKIYVAGIKTNRVGGAMAWFVARLNYDLTLDAGWGVAGLSIFTPAAAAYFGSVRIRQQKIAGNAGKIVASSTRDVGPQDKRGIIWRLTAAGGFDGAGPPNGITQSEYGFGVGPCYNTCMHVDVNDNVYWGGLGTNPGGQQGYYMEKYSPAIVGAVGFGGLGSNNCGTFTPFATGPGGIIRQILEQSDGKILVAGQTPYVGGGAGQVTLARYAPANGVLDAGYAVAGIANFDYHLTQQPTTGPSAALLLAGDQIIVAGSTSGTLPGGGFTDGGEFFSARYGTGGVPAEAWHNKLPALGSTSMVWYGAFGTGYPAAVATDYFGCGHTMNDIAVPRKAQAVASKFTVGGALDTNFGT